MNNISKNIIGFFTSLIILTIASCGGSDDSNPVSDFTATVSLSSGSNTISEDVGSVTITLTLSKQNTSGNSITIPLSISGTATSGTDYESVNTNLTIASGQTSGSLTLNINDDSDEESVETIIVALGTSLPDGITADSGSSITISINDNDATSPTTYTVTISGTENVSESSSEAVFTIALDKANDSGSTMNFTYSVAGTATASSDFTSPSGTASIANGSSEVSISIPLINDTDVESDETIILSLDGTSLPSNVSLGTTTELTITILDNDEASSGDDVVLTFGSASGNSIEITSWTNIGADNYVIVISDTDSFSDFADSDDPASSTTYAGTGEQVVYNGSTISTLEITLLESGREYYFKAFPLVSGIMDNAQLSQAESTVSCSTSSTNSNQVCWEIDVANDSRYMDSNQWPNHTTGNFPNADVTATAYSKTVDLTPELSGSVTYVYDETGGPTPMNKNFYKFGIASNGVGYNPMGLKPWEDPGTGEQNWEWQEKVTEEGETDLDAYGAHVTSAGVYHYHGDISGLAADEDGSRHSLIYGFAADGFPIYYKYGYSDPNDPTSAIVELLSSYELKSGSRPGDGASAPDGTYDGTYIQDFEFNSTLAASSDIQLDECNGRTGVTPEYPDGTYYYVITSEFPKIPNCFKGTPSTTDGSEGFIIGEG